MKLKTLIIASALFGGLLSCTDDNLISDNNQEPEQTAEDLSDRIGYLAVKMKMSDGGSTTRVSYKTDDTWGKYERYVSNFDILIFRTDKDKPIVTAEDELKAKFVGYASAPFSEWTDLDQEDIEERTIYIAMVDDLLGTKIKNKDQEIDGNFYGYIIANVSDRARSECGYLKISTFEDLYNIEVSGQDFTYNGNILTDRANFTLPMTSAPEWQQNGDDPHHLVELNLDNVEWFPKGTIVKENMIKKSAANFYIQRNVSKLTTSSNNFDFGNLDGQMTFNGATYNFKNFPVMEEDGGGLKPTGDMFQMIYWGVRNANPETYLVQHTMGLQEAIAPVTYKERFHDNPGNFHRGFWAFDSNYTTEENKSVAWLHPYKNLGYPCPPYFFFENTMTPENMLKDRTTAIQYIGNYYVEGKKMLEEGKDLTYTPFIMFPGDRHAYTEERLLEYINQYDSSLGVTEIKLKESGAGEEFQGGLRALKDLIDFQANGATTIDDIALAFNLADGSEELVSDYRARSLDGMRYIAPLRHFTDEELGEGLGVPEHIYEGWNPYSSDEYLGRFGTVRNNWYNVNIEYISGPSYTQVDTDLPDDPDDPFDNDETAAIKCTINVLTWVFHDQSAKF
ncbi:MAG: fimbria major subunit [Muribaculaceae bacterium]|nr:fimbria major subunit [Muribaculaceae bacterium]